jgi:16S rRNA (guanine527-N7)-methyltransferase
MFHVKHEAWVRDLDALGLALDPAQLDALGAYTQLLTRLAVPKGMIARSDADRLWERHVWDGLRGAAELPHEALVADLGSGAGIPGVPLAIALPGSRFALIESRRARAAFLEAVADGIGLKNVEILQERVEDVRTTYDACVARAFSSPAATWEAAQPLLDHRGVLVYWAGQSFDRGALDDLGVPIRLSTRLDLARAGPLVIMGPQ